MPSRTKRAATCTELSFFRRKACDGESVIRITSVAFTTSIGQVASLVPAKLLANLRFDPDQQNADAQLPRGQDRTFDFDPRRMVAPHCIQGNGGHISTSVKRQARES